MKKVLLVSLLAIAGVSISAQNLIKNEKFATEVTNKVTNPSKATAGEWFIMNNEADGVTTIAWEQTGDAKYPNAMKIDNSGAEKNTSWYKAFLGERYLRADFLCKSKGGRNSGQCIYQADE